MTTGRINQVTVVSSLLLAQLPKNFRQLTRRGASPRRKPRLKSVGLAVYTFLTDFCFLKQKPTST